MRHRRFAPFLPRGAGALGALLLSVSIPSVLGAVQPGILKLETFGNAATRPQVESGALIPSTIEHVPLFSFVDLGADNYARRVSGYFIPPTDGNYVFFINSDDDSDLFLSTDANPANKRLIAQETTWSNPLEWTTSGGGSNLGQKRSDQFLPEGETNAPFAEGIPLEAGNQYYIEGVHHEGTGGDNFSVTYKLVGEPDPQAGAESLLSGPVIAAEVPATPVLLGGPVDRRVRPDESVTFTVVVDPPGASLQWYRDGAAIPGETATSYTTPPLTAADDGASYQVRATFNGVTSESAEGVITVGSIVPLPNTAKREFWSDDFLTIAELNDPGFSIPPDYSRAEFSFEAPSDFDNEYSQRLSGTFIPEVSGNYVFFLNSDDFSALFLSTDASPANKRQIAQETGWSGIRNWNSVGAAAAGLTAAQGIAQKRSDQYIPDPLNDPTATPPFAGGIALEAGVPYYLEANHEEGGGGDNLAVTFKLVSEPDPVNGAVSRIRGPLLGNAGMDLDGAIIEITNQVQNATGVQSRRATLMVGADSGYVGDATGVGPALNYQWQTAPAGSATFTNIPGALAATYTTPLLGLADEGRQYRVRILAGDASTNTAVATLTVTPDTTAPRPVTVTGVSATRTNITLNFDELLDAASAQNAANYTFGPGNITGATATLANGTNLTITTAAPLTANVENTLTISGVSDVAGNPVAANTTIKFTFNPVTYAANILFDEPLGYYRFQETSGSVATNSGTTGGHGVYYEGDELTPGEGGFPREPYTVPGPSGAEFAGFEPGNLAASFDGFDDWVDTRNQFLQNKAAFTLEYWVKPNRTNEFEIVWPNRVAIVAQNDAVEYGFITPGTIQIWTAGGGSLDAAYTFPDDTWHHVATIGDGTSIRTYFDGELAGTGGTATGNYGSSAYNVHIGGGGGFDAVGNWFTGEIDEVAIFDKAIPADRVAAHYRAGKEGGVITVSGAVTPEQPSGEGTTLSASRSGDDLTISWTPATGTLEATDALGEEADWSEVATSSPATVPIGENARFFRVRTP